MYMFKRCSTRLQATKKSVQERLSRGLQEIPKAGGVAMLTASILIGGGWAAADATTYYLSPTGSNSKSGTSALAPWKTFSFAIPKLKPGDTLVLLNGTYTAANNNDFQVICGNHSTPNAVNGTAS